MNVYLRALGSFKNHVGAWKFYRIIFFWVLTSSILVAEPIFFSRIIENIEKFIVSWDVNNSKIFWDSIIWWAYIFISIIIFFIYRYHFTDKNILSFYVGNLEKSINVSLFTEYWKLLEKKPWELIKWIEKGRESFINFYFFFFLNAFKNLSWILVIIVVMSLIDLRMTFLTLWGIPIVILIWYFFNKKTSYLQKDLNDREDVIFWNISDALSNFSLVKILWLEKRYINSFKVDENKLLDEQYKISYRWAVAHNYTGWLIAIMRLIVLLVWFKFVIEWSLTFTQLLLFFLYIGWIYFPIGQIFWELRQVQRWGASMESYYRDYHDNLLLEDINTWKNIKHIDWNISFQNVSFWYSDDKKILKNINLDIKSGQKIALVWNTWAGKSTMVSLLLRFWDVTEGEILLDGENISNIKKSSLRDHIWVVSQDNSLFNLSVEENLKFSNSKATKKEVEIALKNAEADFVFDLKDGIKTVIWERGLKLSGWEKQRISIARLFLKNPEILILDEATSALDNITEKKIEKALKKLMKWKTSIIIAHRLSTIRHADTIYMLENGKIVEQWSYEDLMNNKKKFYNLANPEKLILW